MKSRSVGLLFGVLFILFGVYLLLDSYFYLEDFYFGSGILTVLALFFYWQYAMDKSRWWGLVLGSIAFWLALIFYVTNTYWIDEEVIAIALFWITGATFIAGFLRNRENWGLIIPAGAAFTLGTIVFSETSRIYWLHDSEGFILFFGLALTFGVLYVMSVSNKSLKWAIYPATVLFVLSLITGVADGGSFIGNFIVPVLFIVAGIALLVRSTASRKRHNEGELPAH